MTGPRPLLLLGSGGFAREAAAAADAANAAAAAPVWDVVGFLDDDPARHGQTVGGRRVLGPCAAVDEHPDAAVVACMGNPRRYWSRREVVDRLDLAPERWATLVHPAASIGSARVDHGTVALAHAVATADVAVGPHVAVMPHVVLTHDVRVGGFATLASGVLLGGGVAIGTGAYVGAGARVREDVTVGAWAQVGMGAVVLADVPPGEVWVGSPARRLRSGDVPDDVRARQT